uniref:Uncharacterized protein n=1 Tax=Anguilla anguilla TaxID=7936 RepID=A0A0E9T1Q1_ANGAN
MVSITHTQMTLSFWTHARFQKRIEHPTGHNIWQRNNAVVEQ